jgi:glycosyltransferase involved in cell wall biosynthesis
MDCLWITLADPDPATNGQLIYSKGLIEAMHGAGASLDVVGLARTEKNEQPSDEARLAWHLGLERPQPVWRRTMRRLPVMAQRGLSPSMRQKLQGALGSKPWQAIVFDSICAGWALESVVRHRATCAQPPKLVYLAHNHEVTVARRIAGASRGLRRVLMEVDALRVMHLEQRLLAECDLVTSNTPEDCRTFAAGAAGKPVAFLPPGYGGPRVLARRIDQSVPRRAVIVGSFDWPPKRLSLERFLAEAAPVLAAARVELQIVGAMEADYLAGLRSRYPSITFVGPVDDVRPYMAAARIALVPDLLGGFKLKGLDYVFNRIPILAMRVALPGMPLEEGLSIDWFDDHRALACGVTALIDDLDALNRRQAAAFEACESRFDWSRIGRHLCDRIRRTERQVSASWRASAGAPTSDGWSIPARHPAGK